VHDRNQAALRGGVCPDAGASPSPVPRETAPSAAFHWPAGQPAAAWIASAGCAAASTFSRGEAGGCYLDHISQQGATAMSIIGTIIIGFFAGLLARFLKPGRDKMGFILTTVLGIVGALVATWIGQMLGWYREGDTAGFIMSVLGAILVLVIWGMLTPRGR
jgi:uncharacterized membrane protein YeaQ/YmgE (transglycosylase-associated protein family)